MLESQKQPLLFKLCVLCFLSGCLWFFLAQTDSQLVPSQAAAQIKTKLRVTVIQVPPDDSLVPVELTCEDAELSAPGALEKLTCTVKNNTSKYMTAGALYTTTLIDKGGELIQLSNYTTFDTFLHQDFREDNRDNRIPPHGEYRRTELPTTFEDGVVIKDITMRVDYVEFADASTSGPDLGGSRIIGETRQGAAKYKDWLAKKFAQRGGSVETIIPLLDRAQPLPGDLELSSGEQENGATMYRNFMLKTYKEKGADGVVRHLKRTDAAASK